MQCRLNVTSCYRNVHDPRELAIILEKAEADLAERQHPDPYRREYLFRRAQTKLTYDGFPSCRGRRRDKMVRLDRYNITNANVARPPRSGNAMCRCVSYFLMSGYC